MNYTSAEANKLLKKLNDEYTALLDKETRSRDFRAAMGEDVASVRRSMITLRRRRALQRSKKRSAVLSTRSTASTRRILSMALT